MFGGIQYPFPQFQRTHQLEMNGHTPRPPSRSGLLMSHPNVLLPFNIILLCYTFENEKKKKRSEKRKRRKKYRRELQLYTRAPLIHMIYTIPTYYYFSKFTFLFYFMSFINSHLIDIITYQLYFSYKLKYILCKCTKLESF